MFLGFRKASSAYISRVLGGMGSNCTEYAGILTLLQTHTYTQIPSSRLEKKEPDFHGNLATYITKASEFTFSGVCNVSPPLLSPES